MSKLEKIEHRIRKIESVIYNFRREYDQHSMIEHGSTHHDLASKSKLCFGRLEKLELIVQKCCHENREDQEANIKKILQKITERINVVEEVVIKHGESLEVIERSVHVRGKTNEETLEKQTLLPTNNHRKIPR